MFLELGSQGLLPMSDWLGNCKTGTVAILTLGVLRWSDESLKMDAHSSFSPESNSGA